MGIPKLRSFPPPLGIFTRRTGDGRYSPDFSKVPDLTQERVHPDGGHLLPEEDPEWVAAAIAAFLPTRTEERR